MILIDELSKTYRRAGGKGEVQALADITVSIKDGEFVAVVGPSGCGKSTLLYMVGGFVAMTAGRILVDGKPVTGPGPDRGPVFQEFALFPWKSVLGNVMYGPRQQGVKPAEAEAQSRHPIRAKR